MINNPYIDLVKKHDNIFTDVDTIYSYQNSWNSYFGNREGNIILEIGTGLGNFFSREVKKNPEDNFIGMEIKYKRLYITAEKSLGHLNSYSDNGTRPKRVLDKISNSSDKNTSLESEHREPNFTLLKDFGEHIDKIFGKNEISRTYIFFPDPWAKKKKWLKNRLLQEEFFHNLFIITQDGGNAIIKTDHREYFDFILQEVLKTPWEIKKKSYNWEEENEFDNSETTEFQQLFRGQNIKINYLELEK